VTRSLAAVTVGSVLLVLSMSGSVLAAPTPAANDGLAARWYGAGATTTMKARSKATFTLETARRPALTASVASAAPAGDGASSAPAAETASAWQLFPGINVPSGTAALLPTWTANRTWVLASWGNGGTLASARVAGTKLASFSEHRLAAGDVRGVQGLSNAWFVDGQLIVRTNGGGLDDPVGTARLLPDGRLGAAQPVPDDLVARAKEAVPQVEAIAVHNAVRVRDRIVWILEGFPPARGISDSRNYLLACCSQSGAAVDLTPLKGGVGTGLLFPLSGWDARGRLWLAWLDTRDYRGAVLGVPHLLQLDAATLAPRSRAVAAPGVVAAKYELVCASTCRIVAQTNAGEIVSWAPGERSPTRIAKGWRPTKIVGSRPDIYLLAAAYRSGRLVVAYHGSRGKTGYSDTTVHDEIRVVRGDDRGARARVVVDGIRVANNWPPSNPAALPTGPLVHGVFGPAGLVVVEQFQYTRGNTSPVIGAFFPVGR
jgi:hypothetical protein